MVRTYVVGGRQQPGMSLHGCPCQRFVPSAMRQQAAKAHVSAVPAVLGSERAVQRAVYDPLQQQRTGWSERNQRQPYHGQAEQWQQQQQLQSSMPFVSDISLQHDCGHAADLFICSVQQCSHWGHVAELVAAHHQQQELTISQVTAALEQLCQCTPVKALAMQQRQQLDATLDQLASAALKHLPQLHHDNVGELLCMFQLLAYRPLAPWVKAVLQHAGTELVHYTPGELALLLPTATQAVSRTTPAAALPMLLFTRSSPSAGPVVTIVAAQLAGDSGAGAGSLGSASGDSITDSQSARRANTVVTSAWLQLFMTTFERYIACRTAHPQLQPQHLEAVISNLAALKVVPDKFWLYLFVRQLSAQLPASNAAGIVQILSALAGMGYKLPDHVISQIERQLGGSALASLRPADCVQVVKSVAALKYKPSEAWKQQLLAHVLKGSTHLSASSVVTLMTCTAALGIALKPTWMDVLLLQARATLQMLSASEYVGLMDALSQQRHRPGPVFMSVYMSQVQGHLPQLSLGQQSVLIGSLAVVGYKPAPTWMAAFMGQLTGQQVAAADAGELLKLLTALRRMQYVPTTKAAQHLEGLIDSIALSLPFQQLQQLRGALAELQYKPYVAAAASGSNSRTTEQPVEQATALDGQPGRVAVDDYQAATLVAESIVPNPDVVQVVASSDQDPDIAGLPSNQQQHQLSDEGRSSANVMENLELFA